MQRKTVHFSLKFFYLFHRFTKSVYCKRKGNKFSLVISFSYIKSRMITSISSEAQKNRGMDKQNKL